MIDEQTRRAAERIRWFHSIDLGGYVTQGEDDTAARAAGLRIPADPTGDSTLYRAARSMRRALPHVKALATRTPRPPTHPAQGRAVFHAYR